MNRKIIFIAAFALLFGVSAFAQTPTSTPMPTPTVEKTVTLDGGPTFPPKPDSTNALKLLTPANLDTILNEAAKQIAFYQETFKNLLATETKTFERFDKEEEIKDQTVVKSIFLVYQSAKDATKTYELRNVLKVDDKLIPDSQARAEKFLEELKKTDNTQKELDKIENESSRYDPTLEINGYTLNQAIPLADNLRPVFEFKLLEPETAADGDAYVVSYRQTKKSSFIVVDGKRDNAKGVGAVYNTDLPDALKKNDVFLRGKLWIDKQTFQIRREERELIAQPSEPVVAFKTEFEYQPSQYEIFVPKKITFTENRLKRVSKNDNFKATKNTIVTFDYTEFKKTDSDVRLLDEN